MILNWGILQDGKCPKCAAKLVMGLLEMRYPCSDGGCGYSISIEEFELIAYGGYRPVLHHEVKKKGNHA